MSVLLEAGVDESVRGSEGRLPRDSIGLDRIRLGGRMDRGKEVALHRMLKRGPAYRARSWAWPSDEETYGGGIGDVETSAAAADNDDDDDVVLSSPPAMKPPPVLGVRIFRPMENSSRSNKFLVRLIGR